MAGQWDAIKDLQARVDKLEGKKAPSVEKPKRVRKKLTPKA